jgi:hypothetical protein
MGGARRGLVSSWSGDGNAVCSKDNLVCRVGVDAVDAVGGIKLSASSSMEANAGSAIVQQVLYDHLQTKISDPRIPLSIKIQSLKRT